MEYVEVARAASERGELVLRERIGDDKSPRVMELRANGIFVMDTSEHASERALAEAALGLVATPRRVLVGGLGLGFTLDRVLGDRRVEKCVVVEIEPALVDWMRNGTVPHGPRLLADSRVRTVVADVAVALDEAAPASYDVVLLDVDNGPGYLVHDANAELYRTRFLRTVHERLAPGGAVAFWSAARAPELLEAMGEAFAHVEESAHAVRLQDRDEQYWLYAGRRPPPAD